MIKSFAPVIANDARILVLGSMPGVESLRQQQYYAHPRNLFWRFMAEALNKELPEEYNLRLQIMTDVKVALWDVLQQCRRSGSLDSAIEKQSETGNDILQLLRMHSDLRKICFNGQKAFSAFKKHILNANGEIESGYNLQVLPSTSPANAGIAYERKLEIWREEVWCCKI